MITPEQLARSGSEHGEQAALFCYFNNERLEGRYLETKWLFAIPNGFFATSGQKAKMKAEGLKSGVPDICLPWPKHLKIFKVWNQSAWVNGPYMYGLWIELKRKKKGVTSDEQSEWIEHLNKQGYYAKVCYGWEAARDTIIEYLK